MYLLWKKCRLRFLTLAMFSVMLTVLFVAEFRTPYCLNSSYSFPTDVVTEITRNLKLGITTGVPPSKLILLWNSFADLNLKDGSGMFHRFKCPQIACSITRDRTRWTESAVVLFHMRDTVTRMHLPNDSLVRPAGQKWTFVMKEPPVYSEFDAAIFNGIFDWTMTYRHDSDIPWPYGGFVKRPHARLVPDYFLLKLNSKNSSTVPGDFNNNSVSWIVSRCKSDTKREDFVTQLQRHIGVAIYGRCGRLKCSRENSATDACLHIPKFYHFYLAFENSFCPDYITEKLYKILAIEDHPPIPIVMGGANYSAVAPPESVINVDDFSSPQQLAEFLKAVMSDRDLYNSFHAWRKNYRVFVWGTPSAMCQLCSKAHGNSLTPTVPHMDLNEFWDKKACHR